MEPLTEQEIRASFVNCTKGEARRLAVPRDLAARPWQDLDFLGWRDPQAPGRAYLVAERGGRPVGVQLRSSPAGSRATQRGMCSVCGTVHTGGVALLVAPRSGRAGQRGDSVGVYMCSDLACSLYVRGKKDAGFGGRLHESLALAEKVRQTVAHLDAFLAEVTA